MVGGGERFVGPVLYFPEGTGVGQVPALHFFSFFFSLYYLSRSIHLFCCPLGGKGAPVGVLWSRWQVI